MPDLVVSNYSIFINTFLKVKEETPNLTVLSRGGLFLAREGTDTLNEDKEAVESGLMSAITMFIERIFNSELNQVKLKDQTIFLRRSRNFMVYFISKDTKHNEQIEIQGVLGKLLEFLEDKYPEAMRDYYNVNKIKQLLWQFSIFFYEKIKHAIGNY